MSDSSQGPGWWQASDGKWYPPEQAPGYQAPGAGGPYGAPYGGGGGASSFDVGAAFNWTIAKYQQFLQPLLILGLVVGGIPFLLQLVAAFTDYPTKGAFLLGAGLVSLFLAMLSVQAGLEIATTGSLNTADMWGFKANLGVWILTALLFWVMSIVGLALCCVGYAFVYLIFGLWQYVIVDRRAGVIDSLTASKDLVLGPGFGNTFLGMLIFWVLSAIAGLSSLLCIFVSIVGIITIPLASLFGAYVYKSFSGQPVAA